MLQAADIVPHEPIVYAVEVELPLRSPLLVSAKKRRINVSEKRGPKPLRGFLLTGALRAASVVLSFDSVDTAVANKSLPESWTGVISSSTSNNVAGSVKSLKYVT